MKHPYPSRIKHIAHLEEYRDRSILDGDTWFYVQSAIAAGFALLVMAGLFVALGRV